MLRITNKLPGKRRAWLILSMAVLLSGCLRTGPKTVVRDRFDYNTAIGDSLKEQMLLNIVKLRYLDVPVFIEVAQIINSYEFQKSASIFANVVGDEALNVGVSGSYSNRPTITYTPLTGNQYLRGLVTPLPPETVFFAIQSGYAADLIIRTTIASINGLPNDLTIDDSVAHPDSGFARVAALIRVLQQAAAIKLIVKIKPDKERVTMLALGTKDQTPALREAESELKRLLRLREDSTEFRLGVGGRSESDLEIEVETRSLIQILGTLSAFVEVPPEQKGAATKGFAVPTSSPNVPRLFRIASSVGRPLGAFAAVRYRNRWYWIEDTDIGSKRIFAVVILLFSFGDVKGAENLPVLTVPVN
jgi:hypothetical protein